MVVSLAAAGKNRTDCSCMSWPSVRPAAVIAICAFRSITLGALKNEKRRHVFGYTFSSFSHYTRCKYCVFSLFVRSPEPADYPRQFAR